MVIFHGQAGQRSGTRLNSNARRSTRYDRVIENRRCRVLSGLVTRKNVNRWPGPNIPYKVVVKRLCIPLAMSRLENEGAGPRDYVVDGIIEDIRVAEGHQRIGRDGRVS